MSADNWTPKRWSRRRAFLVGGTVTAGLAAGALGTVLALAGTPAAKAPAASAVNNGAASRAPISKGALTAISQSAGTGASYYAYLAAAGGDEVVEVNVAAASIVGTFSADSGEGVGAAPDGSEIYIAETGQYSVLAVNPATKAEKAIEVGPYPQDVAVSPAGKVVYATVTGGDTGPGGSNVVAVIDPSTDTVTTDIKTGTAPRQVVFSPDGATAYVTTETGIDVISTANSKVTRVIPDPAGPQGIAVSPDGKTLYVTNPNAGTLLTVNAASGAITGDVRAGAEPEAVAVTPNGAALYVADMNSDSVSVLSAATLKTTGTISVGRLPMSVTVSPDGSQAWVGNGLSGSVSIIATATGKVVATVGGGPGTSTLDAAITDIAFAPAP